MKRSSVRLAILSTIAVVAMASSGAAQSPGPAIAPTVRLNHPDAGDQDDLCIWRDADEPGRSLVIASDKKANLVAVYDLAGRLLQTLPVPKPGNIDLRQGVRCGDETRDLVVVNQRTDGWKLVVFAVDRTERRLTRIDRDDLTTGPNYGVCLYHSRKDGRLHAIITSEAGTMEQYAFRTDGPQPAMDRVRHWTIGKCEAAVADDELGRLYISEEERGVWELGAEPDQATPGTLVIRLGENGLKPDLEGVALLKSSERDGYLFLSSQGQSKVYVYERAGAHRFVGAFAIEGAEDTDGIEVFAEPLGPEFPRGLFGCHTAAAKPCGILLTPWEKIAGSLKIPLR